MIGGRFDYYSQMQRSGEIYYTKILIFLNLCINLSLSFERGGFSKKVFTFAEELKKHRYEYL
jgi:hypothetical protein